MKALRFAIDACYRDRRLLVVEAYEREEDARRRLAQIEADTQRDPSIYYEIRSEIYEYIDHCELIA